MVWGGVSYTERLLFLSLMGHGKQQYLNLLKRRWKEILNLFRNRKIWFFQQDGAPSHRHRPKRMKTYKKVADAKNSSPSNEKDGRKEEAQLTKRAFKSDSK